MQGLPAVIWCVVLVGLTGFGLVSVVCEGIFAIMYGCI